MNKNMGLALEALGIAGSNLAFVMQVLKDAEEPDLQEAYERAQKAMDDITVFLAARLNSKRLDSSIVKIEYPNEDE